ncbi:hypothetical protein [Marinobacter caseinilyticus]|uniref:hypothetical protein n=1 Tax=Marinobacter caseinilyticus TaxID=2692195 RepID=UPI0014098732|nr:hypothetical protein [Marinobacter caseinilyticus]
MSIVQKLFDRLKRRNAPLSEWYQVSFDELRINISAQPPGKDAWEQSITWATIIRVLWQGEGGLVSDGVYLFTSEREESYVVPTESKGGDRLVKELINRGYFSSDKFTKAVTDPYGFYCWPEDEQST